MSRKDRGDLRNPPVKDNWFDDDYEVVSNLESPAGDDVADNWELEFDSDNKDVSHVSDTEEQTQSGGGNDLKKFEVETLDDVLLVTDDEFKKYTDLLISKLSHFKENANFVKLVEELAYNICKVHEISAIRKLITHLTNIANKKTLSETQSKKKSKSKKNPTIYVDSPIVYEEEYDYDYEEDNY